MHKKNISSLFLIFLFFVATTAIAQNTHEINFRIVDSVIIKKNYPYATKVNLEISVQDFQNKIFLYQFDKCVSSCGRLTYFVKDEDQQEVAMYQDWYSLLYKDPKNEPKCQSTGFFVNSRQKIIRKQIPHRKQNNYDFAKYEINAKQQKITLYLLLSIFHKDLPKGKYYLYLVYYSDGPGSASVFQDINNDNRTFKGSVVSNKVKLIVE